VVKSLGGFACGPVGLIRTQSFRAFLKEKTHLNLLVHAKSFDVLSGYFQ